MFQDRPSNTIVSKNIWDNGELTTAMRYQEVKPNAAAGRFVRCYWMLEETTPGSGVQRIVPDGRPELILNLGQPYESRIGETWKLQPRCFLLGQITGPLLLRSSGPVRTIGIRFHPHTAGRLLKIPISDLTDTAVPLDDISGCLCRQLEGFKELRSPREQFTALDDIVLALADRAAGDDGVISGAVGALSGEFTDVRTVADHAGLSPRQFERRFRQAVGIPPKLFSRMQRFQRVFPALENTDVGWADLAVECGYYDQAHLIRDFREFAGKPPAALLSKDTDLARHFVQRAHMSHFSKTRTGTSR